MTRVVSLPSRQTSLSCRDRALHALCALVLGLSMLIGVGTQSAFAQGKIDPNTEMDGRLVGYESTVGIEKDSTTPLWFVYFFLVVVGCSALFKTAKRE